MSIKVMIVDDSAVMREVMQQMLQGYADIEVIGAAMDPLLALQKMERAWPDVILLDVEMPRMDGITFLRQIMSTRPTPVVICSTLTEKGADITLQALAAGAVEVICKPTSGLRDFLQASVQELVGAIRTAARARARPSAPMPAPEFKRSADALLSLPGNALLNQRTTERIVVMGTSTGGTQALEHVLCQLPLNAPGIAIVQHMPEKFTRSFAQRLDSLCAIEVREAQDGDRILPGRALIAPGGRHLLVRRSGAQYLVEVRDGPLVSRHRPSVDVLFRSAAVHAGRNALGVIMTGMGDDGARGLKEMHEAGARTCAQDEDSCVVFGMPKEAIRLGGVDQVVSLERIAQVVTEWR
ncbi:Chemotaxis response regulator protein-glutamate methylesterase of group 2 operon [Pseudomonas knackmussii B13]|uniref:Protein-glutamate methylesterase/protein-glutamine glutaminase n=1 Tax=Pseudomonas knackmussii (strain DSM 6978 / CCUG 54928 / LMG 23759 / B13) TaxID=1301098 RepID=A0A024HCH5_PSEKB|nr:chemotaxis response regulator protein-glutamate methylesterase [Pseudomonas knackmussii]CDF82168.1 Chemotaxis response regulator protein-glutamate methylesterase of group 2 operon [Pseudomonas knackmussii B13]